MREITGHGEAILRNRRSTVVTVKDYGSNGLLNSLGLAWISWIGLDFLDWLELAWNGLVPGIG